MLRYTLFVFVLVPLLALVACRGNQAETNKRQLTVSIIPQKYLAAKLAGDKWDIQLMLPTGANHETYEPAPRDMEKIASSKLYLAIGALDFELSWLDRFKAANPEMKVINTSQGIVPINGHADESDLKSGVPKFGIDPHTWLSVGCMKVQADNICKALCESDTANSAFYKENLRKFTLLADSVDRVIRTELAGSVGKPILIFHPALAYFCRDYRLTQISIEQDGKEPSPASMAELVKTAKEKGIKAVFISKEFDTRNAASIAGELNGKVVIFDPMAENWPVNMLHLAKLVSEN